MHLPKHKEPEEEFNEEDLKNLDNDLGESVLKNEDDNDDGDLLDLEDLEDACGCPECSPDSVKLIHRFRAAIPKNANLELTDKEISALIRTCAAQKLVTGNFMDTSKAGELEDLVYRGIKKIHKCLSKTLDIQKEADRLGADTIRDLGPFVTSMIEEMLHLGTVLTKMSAMSRK